MASVQFDLDDDDDDDELPKARKQRPDASIDARFEAYLEHTPSEVELYMLTDSSLRRGIDALQQRSSELRYDPALLRRKEGTEPERVLRPSRVVSKRTGRDIGARLTARQPPQPGGGPGDDDDPTLKELAALTNACAAAKLELADFRKHMRATAGRAHPGSGSQPHKRHHHHWRRRQDGSDSDHRPLGSKSGIVLPPLGDRASSSSPKRAAAVEAPEMSSDSDSADGPAAGLGALGRRNNSRCLPSFIGGGSMEEAAAVAEHANDEHEREKREYERKHGLASSSSSQKKSGGRERTKAEKASFGAFRRGSAMRQQPRLQQQSSSRGL